MTQRKIALPFALGILLCSILLLSPERLAGAAQQATWPEVDVSPLVGGLEAPVYLTHAGDGSGRLFVVEQRGRVRIVQDGKLFNAPFLDIAGRVRSPFSAGGGEEGLLSIAFPSDYEQQGYFFVFYTNQNGDNQVSRFHRGSDENTADPQSEAPVLVIEHPGNANHNGGQLAFGPDGNLYIGAGDGGGGGDPDENAQDPAQLLGKLLRIDVGLDLTPPAPAANRLFFPLVFTTRQNAPAAATYRVPGDNPFSGDAGYRPEIWALGLRNPWRFSFDRQTGDLFIADVGQGDWEEIDFQPRASAGGENYGWDVMEGPVCYEPSNCSSSGLALPVFAYRTHVNGTCAITGGYVYRGQAFPALQGIYFYGDYCNGKIWGLQPEAGEWANQELTPTGARITSFGEDEAGELYVLVEDGRMLRVIAGQQ